MLGLEDIQRAQAQIGGRVRVTPVMSSATIGDELGVRLDLKAELFQKTGSFKPRGVFNKLLSMDRADHSRGLVSLSAGNHAAALAYGAAAVGETATIVMPAAAMPSKVAATRRYGGEVVQTDGSLLDACLALQRERNLTMVHPFDDLAVMAGQGTVGLEILEQIPDAGMIVVPVGGGGLISGIAAAVKLQHSSVRVVGVEPEGADAMSRPRRDRAMKSIVLIACSPCTPPAVVTRPIGLLARYGGSFSASRISQSRAFLKAPLTDPWYVGLDQISASA
jgi:threonine dehydratase